MSEWLPDLEGRTGPVYRRIADAIVDAISSGVFRPGDRLPTHRELARRLGIPVSSVSRGYVEAEHRGFVTGEIGRGTFVRGFDEESSVDERATAGPAEEGAIDLASNYPPALPGCEDARELATSLRELATSSNLTCLLAYGDAAGQPSHREAGAEWLCRLGLDVGPDRVLVANAAHHAISVTLAALTNPGDTLLTESLTYPAIKSIAQLLHLRLEGVEMDGEGLLPRALADACERHRPAALICVPTIQNPTAAVMPEARRAAVAAVVEEYGLPVNEDEIHGGLVDPPVPPLASYAPGHVHLVASLSKSLAPGLRVSYLLVPRSNVTRVAAALWASTWMTAPLMGEIASRWIRDGAAERILERRRQEASLRQSLAADRLEGCTYTAHPNGFHVWLQLPEPWHADAFVQHARQQGVLLSPTTAFAVGERPIPAAARICLGGPRDRESVSRALETLAGILRRPPDCSYFPAP